MYCREREKEMMGSNGRFGEVDQILKVGKSKGFWSLEKKKYIEALIETFQTSFLVSLSYISLSSNRPLILFFVFVFVFLII